MTLRTAARVGIAGSAMPFAGIASWVVAVAVAGRPLENQSLGGGPLQLAMAYLWPAAVFGFLAMLYLVSAGHIQPSHLGDAALAASALAVVGLAANLPWAAFPRLFSGLGHGGVSWLSETHWRTAQVPVPVAWLAFLVSFIRWPGPPPARGSCRAAGWLGLAIGVAGVWPVLSFVYSVAFFSMGFPSRGVPPLNAWMAVVGAFIEAARWVLLCIFALAVWRMRPAAE